VHRLVLLWLLTVCAAPRVSAQGLAFKVAIVDWDASILMRQQSSYRTLRGDREVLYCIESWRTESGADTFERLVIEKVRAARGGGTNRITDVGDACVGAKGEPLPMFHTHADGNCQFSPSDLVTLVARRAPFEGIQCGPHHFAWEFAWRILAVSNNVERAGFTGRKEQ